MAQLVTRGRGATLTALCTLWSVAAAAQQRDTMAPPHPADSLKVYTLPPAVVSVTRANPPINRIPQAVHLIERTEISRGCMRRTATRSEEHTSELQSRLHLVCRLLLEKKKK